MPSNRKSFATSLVERLPPWWGRVFGAPIVRGLAGPFDECAQDTADSVKLRFPLETSDPAALAVIGRERRILRGPHEDDASYSSRLPSWLDDHATRGGPYVLARQLWLFWRSSINVPFEIIYHSGRRYSVDILGNVVRDDIVWSADGSEDWSQFWIVFHMTGLSSTWVDETGDVIVADGGEEIIFDVLTGGALTAAEAADFASVPREWSAAHVKQIHIVLLYGGNRLWGYPRPVTTWGAWGTWQSEQPARVEIEDQ